MCLSVEEDPSELIALGDWRASDSLEGIYDMSVRL